MVSVSKGMCHILFFSTLKQFGAVVQKNSTQMSQKPFQFSFMKEFLENL